MKKSILTVGLFSLMMILTSFTAPTEIGGNQGAPKLPSAVEIGGNQGAPKLPYMAEIGGNQGAPILKGKSDAPLNRGVGNQGAPKL